MRRVVLILAVVGTVLILASRLALAQATTETFVQEFDISGGRDNPCTGQFIDFTGTQRIVFHVTKDDAGNIHITDHAITRGSGVDPVTGEKFLYRDVGSIENFTAQEGTPTTFSSVTTFDVISNGPSPNFLFHTNFHITVNANGEPTAEVDNFFLECQGQGNPPDPEQ